jgi:hypothetical protein
MCSRFKYAHGMPSGMPYRVIESTKRGSRVITCVVDGVAVGDCFYC